ncbi:MAG: hypothetical protein PHY23_00030 [Oscillospiraceae bacterium]|nr:hypothetical protein [Oscillospiraceae bacterium]
MNRAGNFRKSHLRNIAGGRAEGIERFRRVEVQNIPEVLVGKVFPGVDAAPCQQHIRHAVLKRLFVENFGIKIVQFL